MKLQALAFIGFMGGMKLCDYVFFDNVSNNNTKSSNPMKNYEKTWKMNFGLILGNLSKYNHILYNQYEIPRR